MPRRVSRAVRPHPGLVQQPAAVLRVRPRNDRARRVVRHYPSGTGFTDEVNGTPWPNDGFTHRRIRDGDIEVVETPAIAPPEDTGPVRYGETFGEKDLAPSKRKSISGL